MNHTLRHFKSYDEIDSRKAFIDVLSLTSLFGIVTNSMCIYVLKNLSRSEFMIKFMLAYSLLDLSFH